MNKKEITEEDCFKWKKDKFRNPHTNYEFKAKEKSQEYKRFKKACEGIKTPELNNKKEIELIYKNIPIFLEDERYSSKFANNLIKLNKL